MTEGSATPAAVGDLTFVKAPYPSIHVWIASEWRIENGALHLEVTLPPGTTATVYTEGPGRGGIGPLCVVIGIR